MQILIKKRFDFRRLSYNNMNEEMNDNMSPLSLEESGYLIKGVNKTIKNKAKEEKGRFRSMLLCTLGASLLGNILTGKDTIIVREGTIRAGQNFLCHLILQIISKYKSIIKTNLNLMVFIQEIIYLK